MEQIIFTQLSSEQLTELIAKAVTKAVSSHQPQKDKELPEMLTRKQLAEMMGVSLPFLHKQINEGNLKATKFGRLTRFKRADVEAFINSNPQYKW